MVLPLIAGALGKGGGGLSTSSSASVGPARSGDIGANNFSAAGINTGTQNTSPPWLIPAISGAVILAAVFLLRKKL